MHLFSPQPAGKAVALLLVPTMHSGDSRVFLWGQSNVATPVHIFSGHSEAVLDLQWLSSEQLATWSKDRTLRLWGIGKQLKTSLGGGDFSEPAMPSLEDSALHTHIDMSLEESMEPSLPQKTMEARIDPSMSLPALRPPAESYPQKSHGSPSTRSLTSLTSLPEPQLASSAVSPVFRSVGSLSLAQEFSELKLASIPGLEIESVSVV